MWKNLGFPDAFGHRTSCRFATRGEDQMMNTVRRRIVISGLVQGVAFRYYTRAKARQAGATGWVRNLPDGQVEALIEGNPVVVEEVIGWCRKGPPASRVDRVKVFEEPATGEFSDFDISYTGGSFW
jgi:acylphosphatase